jgi:hypothetical protein
MGMRKKILAALAMLFSLLFAFALGASLATAHFVKLQIENRDEIRGEAFDYIIKEYDCADKAYSEKEP